MSSHPRVVSPPRTSRPNSPQIAPTRPGRVGLAVWPALGAVYVIWGSTYLAIRVVAQFLPAFGLAAARFGVAGILLAGILAIARGGRILRISWRQFAATAVVGVLLLAGGNGLVVLAESPRYALPSGVTALVISLNPLIMVVLRLITGDRPRLLTVVGILIGLGGLVLLFLPGNGSGTIPVAGGLLVLGGLTCWCLGSFATRWLPMPENPFVASVYEMVAGSVAMGVIAAALREPALWNVPNVPARAWWGLAYLLVAGSIVAFTAYVYLLQTASITLVTTYAYVNPVIALILGALILGEALTGRVLIAAGTVVLGVILVVSTERRTA